MYPVTQREDYRASLDTVRYWFEGEVWLDQGQTGTCVFNAFDHRLADAPNVEAGWNESIAQMDYRLATGDATLEEGTTALVAARYYQGKGKISAYHWVTSPLELRNTVLELGSVLAGTNWYESMFWPKDTYGNGRGYITVDRSSGLAGGHEYLINGINLEPDVGPPFYRMKNSWGKSWPGTPKGPGTARFACTDLEELIFGEGGDAVLITEVA
jgi:hypothetical protein